ncbi:MAG: hypothetical protein OEZ65_03105 [Gemmatimonadota bacterium]|nr:hypothetical protein [Gemmatimonadota bacterium]MDH5758551.1 hypothetical protein [Gemmatimonadota bacterium]
MDDPRMVPDDPPEIPFFQRLYDSPFVLLAFGLVVMLVLFTFWGLWEVLTLPEATLP